MQAPADDIFKTLADPTPRAIFERLARWQRNQSRSLPKSQNAEENG